MNKQLKLNSSNESKIAAKGDQRKTMQKYFVVNIHLGPQQLKVIFKSTEVYNNLNRMLYCRNSNTEHWFNQLALDMIIN